MTIYILLLLTAFAGDDVWPAFLGAGSTTPSADNIPLTWSPTEAIAWQSPIPGHGQSSPVVWGKRVFVSTVEGPKKDACIVMAFSLIDGTTLWSYSLDNSDPVENSVYVSRAAPTPVVDADRLIVFFESGDLVALDHDGKELWKRSLSQDYGKFQNKFGLSGSPVQTQENIFILVDDEGPSYLVAIDKQTGKTVWKQDRMPRNSWSSPGLVKVGTTEQVVVSSDGTVDGYDALTGKLEWTFSEVGGNTGTSPYDLGDGRFFVAASAGRDGANTQLAKKSNFLMQVQQDGNGFRGVPLWNSDEATPSWASPIAHQGCAYWVNRVGVVYCLDLATGKVHYKERTKQSCWATPVGIGDRVYFFGKDGVTTVLAAGPEFKVLAENVLWDPDAIEPDPKAGANEPTEERQRAAAMFSGPTVYGVAIADGSIVVRTGDKLYCIRD